RQTELMFELSENRRLADRARPVAMRLAEMIESQRTYRVEVGRRVHEGVRIVSPAMTYVFRDDLSGPVSIAADDQGRLEYRTSASAESAPLLTVTESAEGSDPCGAGSLPTAA
ncbi:MAG: hypothetical protein AAGA57_07630, partial [Planctomycetota bacterium]